MYSSTTGPDSSVGMKSEGPGFKSQLGPEFFQDFLTSSHSLSLICLYIARL